MERTLQGFEGWCVQSPGPAALRNQIKTIEASCVARVLRWDTRDAGELIPAFTRSFSCLLTARVSNETKSQPLLFHSRPLPDLELFHPISLDRVSPSSCQQFLPQVHCSILLFQHHVTPCSLALHFFLSQILAQAWDGLVSTVQEHPAPKTHTGWPKKAPGSRAQACWDLNPGPRTAPNRFS